MPAIQPELSVRGGREAVDFYIAAFGATERYRVGGSDEHEPVVAQLAIGDAVFWVSDEAPEHGNHSPESVDGAATVRLLLVVDDPDAVQSLAVGLGATELAPVHEEHGWRLGRIRDPYGHPWEIGRPLGAWPPHRGHPGAHVA
jgi:PhnB protein